MADRKISDLTALTTPATGDLLPIVDVSEAAAADKNKSITVQELFKGVPDGTAAAPGLAFESDDGNGMFLGGTDILAFSTGGTQAVTIDASQRVGIGVTSPDSTLELASGPPSFKLTRNTAASTGNDFGRILFENSAGTTLGSIRGYSESGNTDLGLKFSTGTGDTVALTIDESQRLGVGTTSAGVKLHVSGTDDASIRVANTLNNTPSGNHLELFNNSSEGLKFNVGRSGAGGNSNLTYDNNFNINAGATGVATFDSSGRVGIGTSSPSALLSVFQSAEGEVANFGTSDTSRLLRIVTGTANSISGALITLKTDSAEGEIAFGTGGGTERVRIDNSGNVGIGSASPDGNVHIADSTRANLILKKTGLNDVASGTLADEYDVIQLGAGGSFASYNVETATADTHIGHNFYRHSSGPQRYKYTDAAARIRFNSSQGEIIFDRAASGTANTDITFSESLRIDSSGRLLVGTSSNIGTGADNRDTLNLVSASGAGLLLGRNDTTVTEGNNIGRIEFFGNDSDGNYQECATILVEADGTHATGDKPTRIKFFTAASGTASPTERMRITNQGFLKQSNSGTYISATGSFPEFVTNAADHALRLRNTNGTNPYGLRIDYSLNANDIGKEMIYCVTDTTLKMSLRSNGGITNYQSNNVNLCDEREKKNIEALDSTWGCLKNWDLKKFHYNEDADSDDKRYGVIAQQVAEHCPEVITDWVKQKAEDAVLDDDGNVVTPAKEEIVRMGVKEQQMMWMAIKALQEAQTRIETLEAEVAALKAG